MLGNVANLDDDLSLLREPLEHIAERSVQTLKKMLTEALSPRYSSGNTPVLAAPAVSPRFRTPRTAEEAGKQRTEEREKRRAGRSAIEHSPLEHSPRDHAATFNDRAILKSSTPRGGRGGPLGITTSGERLTLFPAKMHANLNDLQIQNGQRFVNDSLAGNGQKERESEPEKERDFVNENQNHWCRLMDV
jgi:hypothetical protein